MYNLKYGTNAPIYQTNRSQKQRTDRHGGGRGMTGSWGWQLHTVTFRMDKLQGPNVYQRELDSISRDVIMEKNIKKNAHI